MQTFNHVLQVSRGKCLGEQHQSSDPLVPRVSTLSHAPSHYFPDLLWMFQLMQR